MKRLVIIFVLLSALVCLGVSCKKVTPGPSDLKNNAQVDTLLPLIDSVVGTYLMHGTTYVYHLVGGGNVETDTSVVYNDTVIVTACSDSSIIFTGDPWGCGCGCWSYTPGSATPYSFGGFVFYKNYPDSAMVSLGAQTSWETSFSGSLSGRKIR